MRRNKEYGGGRFYGSDLKVACITSVHVAPTPVLLPAEFRGLRSLVGYSPWGHKESDTAEHLTLSLM